MTIIQLVDYRKKDRTSLLSLVRALDSLPEPKPLPQVLPPKPEAPISYLGNIKNEIESDTVLSFEEQSAILIKLKQHLNNESEKNDVLKLLYKFKKRDDLYHKIASQIDELHSGKRYTSSKESNASNRDNQQKRTFFQGSYGSGSIENDSNSASQEVDYVGIMAIIGGLLLPIIGIGLGIWSLTRIKKDPDRYKTKILGWIAIILSILLGILNVLPYM